MLATVPPEVLDHILAYLPTPDLYSLRQTSRAIEKSSRATFARTAFSQLAVDFSPSNLRHLTAIAAHDTFRLAVRSLLIGFWSPRPLPNSIRWPRQDPPGCLDLASEPAREFISAVARFENCTGATVWNGIGPTSVPEGSGRTLSPGDAVALTLAMFSAPGAPPMRFFRSRVNRWHRVRVSAIPPATREAIRPVWAAHLEELVVECDYPDYMYIDLMMSLLTSARRLTTLRLMWPGGGTGPRCSRFSLKHHIAPILQGPAPPPPLRVLMLGQMKLSGEDLIRLVSLFEHTLMDVDLFEVRLESGSWTDVLEHLHAAPFPRLSRVALFRCEAGPRAETLVFCPLWRDEALQASCGGAFEFVVDRVALHRNLHVAGVLFQSSREPPSVKAALRAMLDRSYTVDFEVPRDDGFGFSAQKKIPGLRELPKLGTMTPRVAERYTRWTGLPVLRFAMREESAAPVDPEVIAIADLFWAA